MLLVNNEGTFIYVYVTFFCCCALADSFKFNCCLWNIHSDFLTLLLSCPGGAGVREGGQPGSPAYEVHGEMWRKAASASYKMQVAWQRVLHTSWIMSSAGQRSYKELQGTRQGAAKQSAKSTGGRQADLQSWFWFQLQRHTEMFFAARIVGIKNVYFMFSSRGTSLPCVACSGSVSVSSASSGSLPPKCCVHCRQTHTHTPTLKCA